MWQHRRVRWLYVLTPVLASIAAGCVEPGTSSLTFEGPPVGPEWSVIRPDVDCGSPGFYEASLLDDESVLVTGAWAEQCDVAADVQITIKGSRTEATAADAVFRAASNSPVATTSEVPPVVLIDSFSVAGVVSGTWGPHRFWAIVDRPTLVEFDDAGMVRLELGQAAWTSRPYCLTHNDGSIDSAGKPIPSFYRNCAEDRIKVIDRQDSTVTLMDTGRDP